MERRAAVGDGAGGRLGSATVADAPIGIFDSGFGGLTVARAVLDQLPHEPVALPRRHRAPARTARGRSPRSARYALECLDHLVDQGVKLLVIACNTRQRRGAARRPRALRRARRRGDPAGRPPRGRGHPQRPGRRDLAPPATTTSRRLRRRLRRGPADRASPRQACPRFVEFVEAGVTGGPELLGVAHEYLDPVARGRRRHADPRLHALPAADRRHLLRHGRRRHAGVQRRGDRQGRLPRCSPTHDLLRPDGLPAARAPVPHHRRPATRSRGSAAGSSAPRSAPVAASERRVAGR